MTFRVIARIRPLLEKEEGEDTVVHAACEARDSENTTTNPNTIVKIKDIKGNNKNYVDFSFHQVYDKTIGQEAFFVSEIASHVKSLFQGQDATIFAYGVTGSGKTHTMRGGLKLADRGIIPRLLSNIYRRSKKISKESDGKRTVQISVSYVELYNDNVFDLLQSPDKQPAEGLALRDSKNDGDDGTTMVVGLLEKTCPDLKHFERLYLEANNRRAVVAAKRGTNSSRSHAVLRVTIRQLAAGSQIPVQESVLTAVDLAGSEDTIGLDQTQERLAESASIHKSLFVLGQCIEAMTDEADGKTTSDTKVKTKGQKDSRTIPYQDSKLTRLLSLGRRSATTIMIVTLAPTASLHVDTLSSAHFSAISTSSTKRIEAREIENEIVYKQGPRARAPSIIPSHNKTTITSALPSDATSTATSLSVSSPRRPLRSIANTINAAAVATAGKASAASDAKPLKLFHVFSDRCKPTTPRAKRLLHATVAASKKRVSGDLENGGALSSVPVSRLAKTTRTALAPKLHQSPMPRQTTSGEKPGTGYTVREVPKCAPKFAATTTPRTPRRQGLQQQHLQQENVPVLEQPGLSTKSTEMHQETQRKMGLRLLLAAKKQRAMGEDHKALQLYEQALAYFPRDENLLRRIQRLRSRLGLGAQMDAILASSSPQSRRKPCGIQRKTRRFIGENTNESQTTTSTSSPLASLGREVQPLSDEDPFLRWRMKRTLSALASTSPSSSPSPSPSPLPSSQLSLPFRFNHHAEWDYDSLQRDFVLEGGQGGLEDSMVSPEPILQTAS